MQTQTPVLVASGSGVTSEESRVEFLTLDMDRLSTDHADDQLNKDDEIQDTLSANMMDIIVEHRYPNNNPIVKQHDGASGQIQSAARNFGGNAGQYSSDENDIVDLNAQ